MLCIYRVESEVGAVTQFGVLGETLKRRELSTPLTHRDYGLGLTGTSIRPLVLVRMGWDMYSSNRLCPKFPSSFPVCVTRFLQLTIGDSCPPCNDCLPRLPGPIPEKLSTWSLLTVIVPNPSLLVCSHQRRKEAQIRLPYYTWALFLHLPVFRPGCLPFLFIQSGSTLTLRVSFPPAQCLFGSTFRCTSKGLSHLGANNRH